MRLGKKWPKYEAVSQSLPPQTPIADDYGRAVKECSCSLTPQCPQGDIQLQTQGYDEWPEFQRY